LKTSSTHTRVGIDCRDLFVAKTGSKTYLSEFIKASQALNETGVEYIQLFPFIPIVSLKGSIGKIIRHVQFFWWKQISLPLLLRLKRCDVLICTDYFLPALKDNKKHIVVFHDTFFWEYPQHYNRLWLKMFHGWAVPAAENADRILVPSEYVKNRLCQFMHVNDDKLTVVYEAPKSFQIKEGAGMGSIDLQKYRPYLLHVGAMSKHKNLPLLIKAFKLALTTTSEAFHLVLIGGPGNSRADDDSSLIRTTIIQEDLEGRVHLVGYIEDNELSFYYANASGYVFPSYNEGFGLPLLEAMKFGLPIAAANNTCLPEIGKEAALYFDPNNINELTRAMTAIMVNSEEINAAIRHQPAVLSSYSWKKAALEITAICKGVDG
jgi:glycosyltransferase involved in cell wall biosynthesis